MDLQKNITHSDIAQEVAKYSSKPKAMTHERVMEYIISNTYKVDFREILNIPEEDEKRVISKKEYLVITIDTLLANTRRLNVGLTLNNGIFYLYNGEYWKSFEVDTIKVFLGDFARIIGVNEYDAKFYQFKDDLLKQLSSASIQNFRNKRDDLVVINLLNGTFEISAERQELREFSRDDFMTYQLPFSYDPNAIAPMFEKYLNEVLIDKTVQRVVSEYLGYIFVRNNTLKLEKVAFFYGDGANGKSVMFEIITALLQPENVSTYSIESLTDSTGYYRANIVDKLVNYSSEMSAKVGNSAIFKALASGEPLEVRSPYKEPYSAVDYARLIFNSNNLPSDVEQTEGFFRRFLIIPFDVTIPPENQDKQLSQKIISKELSGVFNWILEGLKRLLEQKKFSSSEKIEFAVKQFRRESDSVALFLEDGLYYSDVDHKMLLKNIYYQYKFFCVTNGYRAVSNKTLKKRLEKLDYQIEKVSKGVVVYINSEISENRLG